MGGAGSPVSEHDSARRYDRHGQMMRRAGRMIRSKEGFGLTIPVHIHDM